jgi:septum site-determining protein MinC
MINAKGVQVLPEENRTVEFKGTGMGLTIKVHLHHDSRSIRELIQHRIDENPSFYQGATLAGITCEALSETARQELEKWLSEEYRMVINRNQPVVKEPARKKESKLREPDTSIPAKSGQIYNTKFVEGTLRSGQKVEHPGDVVVIGDVNPGAEISAGGNIVVMGILRGIAHAGLNGTEGAFVAALVLQPTQLRIHQTISRSPDEGSEKSRNPEIAKLRDKMIYVEPFSVRG